MPEYTISTCAPSHSDSAINCVDTVKLVTVDAPLKNPYWDSMKCGEIDAEIWFAMHPSNALAKWFVIEISLQFVISALLPHKLPEYK